MMARIGCRSSPICISSLSLSPFYARYCRQSSRNSSFRLIRQSGSICNGNTDRMKRNFSRMMPFDSYPQNGRELLGRVKGSNCRHGYCLQFQQVTQQTSCAYCGMSLVDSYERWLTMALDHVIPLKTGLSICIPAEWIDDCINKVLACAACNGFQNRYKLPEGTPCPSALSEFVELRDRTFDERKVLVSRSHEQERLFFDSQPWMNKLVLK